MVITFSNFDLYLPCLLNPSQRFVLPPKTLRHRKLYVGLTERLSVIIPSVINIFVFYRVFFMKMFFVFGSFEDSLSSFSPVIYLSRQNLHHGARSWLSSNFASHLEKSSFAASILNSGRFSSSDFTTTFT